jgi:hypothetical protein
LDKSRLLGAPGDPIHRYKGHVAPSSIQRAYGIRTDPLVQRLSPRSTAERFTVASVLGIVAGTHRTNNRSGPVPKCPLRGLAPSRLGEITISQRPKREHRARTQSGSCGAGTLRDSLRAIVLRSPIYMFQMALRRAIVQQRRYPTRYPGVLPALLPGPHHDSKHHATR